MRITLFVFVACYGLIACGSSPAPLTSPDQVGDAGPPPDAAAGPEIAGDATPAEPSSGGEVSFVSDDELTGLGYRIEAIDGGGSLICQGTNCVCRIPITAPITLTENLQIFRDALANGQGDRTVHCEAGTLGRCGDFTYFLFVGDIHRHEVRWFGPDGNMVARRNVTDYNEFCDGRTLARIMGQIPSCSDVTQTELICGDAQEVQPPLEDLRRLLGGDAPPGSGP